MIIHYRRFGTTYRFHFQGSRIRGRSLKFRTVNLGWEATLFRIQSSENLLGFLSTERGTNTISRNAGKEIPVHAAL